MPRRRRTGELRTRTGCNKCRQRRVKCPEEKPACSACRSLGYECSYDQLLRWQSPQGFDGLILPNDSAVEEWMFLHASSSDFEATGPRLFLTSSSATGSDDSSSSTEDAPQSWELVRQERRFSYDGFELQPWLAPMAMSPVESYLWNYFHGAIAPACVLNPAVNPYQDIILRIAASTGKSLPLFNIIMAISARERAILGDQSYNRVALSYHNQAIRLLRQETSKMEQGVSDEISKAQILATVMALVFLDIMSDCSTWWVVHSDFARSLVHKFRTTAQPSCDEDMEALFNFVGGYIVVHEVYAHTAWNPTTVSTNYNNLVTDMCDDANLQTLTGCSTEFLQILANVNSLAADYKACSKLDHVDPERLASLERRRHDLERRLHEGASSVDLDDPSVSESQLTIELKRLTGLLHLYSRIDHLGPRDPYIAQLASRILALIARVPTRSNIILWPLFMVATLGIGHGCDTDRAFILAKLDQLQQKRQMRYIKKAREIAIEVWKVRDLKEPGLRMGWDILDQAAKMERISLF